MQYIYQLVKEYQMKDIILGGCLGAGIVLVVTLVYGLRIGVL